MLETGKRHRRIWIISFSVAIAGILVSAQYARIMVLERTGAPAPSTTPRTVERGAILDRNGRILAIQTQLYTVSAWIPNVTDPQETASDLARILDDDAGRILDLLEGSRDFVYIQRRITPTRSEEIRASQHEGRLRGIQLEPDSGRTYPNGRLGSHVIGHVGTDNNGLDGVEYTYDSVLSPSEGRVRGETLYGNQLVLTIDLNIQQTTDRLARETLERENADSVMLLVMDAKNGEILSWSSVPDYDPNRFSDFDIEERRNRPIRMMYEPGSVFKVFSVATMLNSGAVSDGDIFETDGTYRPESWRDASPITDIANYGTMDLRRVMERSSNVGVAYASEDISEQEMYRGLKRFGFGEPTGVGLSGEQNGILYPPERWSYRSKPTIAMGQEIGVTALQIAAAATTFSNDGVLLQPSIIRRIVSADGRVIEESERTAVREVLTPSVAAQMKDYMRTSTHEGGTGRRVRIDGIEIAAKTGTAEFFDPEIRAYSDEKFIGSTLAMFPSNDPEVIVYMVVENPQGDFIWGERVAAPVVREAAQFLIPYLGIEQEGDRRIAAPEQVQIQTPGTIEIGGELPDLRGLPRRSILQLEAMDEISVEVHGSGWVTRQIPEPGTPIEEVSRVILELE